MGQQSSATLPYEEAVRRLGRREVAAIEEGFNRLAFSGRLSRQEFRTGFLNSVSSAPVPEALASALFNGFDHDASGYVTVQEKLRLLFAAYDADRDRRLSDRDLSKFVSALHEGRSAPRERAVDDALTALAAVGPQVNFPRFAQWARAHIDTPLVDWIFDLERRLAVTELQQGQAPLPMAGQCAPEEVSRMAPLQRTISAEQREDAAELRTLAEKAGLDQDLATELRAVWRQVAAESQFGVVDASVLRRMLPSAPGHVVDRFFDGLDRNRSGTVSLRQWLVSMAICLQGSAAARQDLCFHLFMEQSGEDAGEQLISAASAAELWASAESARTLFRSDLDTTVGNPHGTGTCPMPALGRGLLRGSLKEQPWAARAEELLRGLGHVARVDLKLQPRDPREERHIVDSVNAKFDPERPGCPGATWYVISARWWEQWCEYSGATATLSSSSRAQAVRPPAAPPSINNGELVEEHGWLRLGLGHHDEYEVITAGAWLALHAWYGGPGPPLPRQTVDLDGRCELEMYPLRLRVSRTDETGHILLLEHSLISSRVTKLSEVRKMACSAHQITEDVVVYQRSGEKMDWLEANEEQTLNELAFLDGHQLLLRPQVAGPEPLTQVSSPTANSLAVGLQNLGNTCYMNASIQCLVHTPLLPDYFKEAYLLDVNSEGTWGMVGKLAVVFAELLAEIRKSQFTGAGQMAPRTFKRTIGDFRPRFAGWNQQDAQEFLSIFLSGLSEDVNRAKGTKPYVELKDSNGRLDEEVAQEYWSSHCARERSVVAALFSGQFKSVLRCIECGHENASFDPFSFLPVPLPEHDFRWVTCVVVGAQHAMASPATVAVGAIGCSEQPRCQTPPLSRLERHAVRLCTRVPKRGQVADVLAAAAGLLGLAAEGLVAADVADGYVFRLLDKQLPLASLGEDAQPTLFHAPSPSQASSPAASQALPVAVADEATMSTTSPPSAVPGSCSELTEVVVYIVHRRLTKAEKYFLNPFRSEVFGSPALLRMRPSCSALELYTAVWQQVRHLVPDLEEPLSAGSWPFSLSTVKRDGSACSRCSWRQACLGCVIPAPYAAEDDSELEPLTFGAEETLGVNWDGQVLQSQYRGKIAAHVHVHESVPLAQLERDTPERLVQCLDGLVKEEKLHAYCSGCSKARNGEYTETDKIKSLQLWGCPPLLVLHLKRFHYGASGYKLHNLINFPMRLDLSDYLVPNHSQAVGSTTSAARDAAVASAGFASVEGVQAGDAGALENGNPQTLEGWDRPLRERQPSESCDAGVGFPSLTRQPRSDLAQYELYAVINHIGGYGSGHYTAHVKSNGRWLCCNDSQVYKISEEDVVTANAYLLFYARSDVATGRTRLESLFPKPQDGTVPVDPESVKRARWTRPPDVDGGTRSGITAAAIPGGIQAAAVSATSGACHVM